MVLVNLYHTTDVGSTVDSREQLSTTGPSFLMYKLGTPDVTAEGKWNYIHLKCDWTFKLGSQTSFFSMWDAISKAN